MIPDGITAEVRIIGQPAAVVGPGTHTLAAAGGLPPRPGSAVPGTAARPQGSGPLPALNAAVDYFAREL